MFMILATLMAGAVWLVGDIKLWNCHDHHLDSCGSQQPACTGLDVCITQISGSDWNNKEQKYLLDCMYVYYCLSSSVTPAIDWMEGFLMIWYLKEYLTEFKFLCGCTHMYSLDTAARANLQLTFGLNTGWARKYYAIMIVYVYFVSCPILTQLFR